MNAFLHLLRIGMIGLVVGFITTGFNVLLIKRWAKRTQSYKMNYWPVTIPESKLVPWSLVAYPTFTVAIFVILAWCGIIH